MKGICFKPHLHELTISGTKIQTRRILIAPKIVKGCEPESLLNDDGSIGCVFFSNGYDVRTAKPRYNVGEVLFLKETYRIAPDVDFIIYKSDYPDGRYEYPGCDKVDTHVKWENKLFMPARYARHFIKITAVRAERLQDISDEDCIREGIAPVKVYDGIAYQWHPYTIGPASAWCRTPKSAYSALIDSINGENTWNSNPYVWVYDYELVQPHSPL